MHLRLETPLSDMIVGPLKSVAKEIREYTSDLCALLQSVGNPAEVDLMATVRETDSSLFFSPVLYFQILSWSEGPDQARLWFQTFQDRLNKSPEQYYSSMLAEGGGLSQCSVDQLLKLVQIYQEEDTTQDYPFEFQVMQKLRDRNMSDRWVLLER